MVKIVSRIIAVLLVLRVNVDPSLAAALSHQSLAGHSTMAQDCLNEEALSLNLLASHYFGRVLGRVRNNFAALLKRRFESLSAEGAARSDWVNTIVSLGRRVSKVLGIEKPIHRDVARIMVVLETFWTTWLVSDQEYLAWHRQRSEQIDRRRWSWLQGRRVAALAVAGATFISDFSFFSSSALARSRESTYSTLIDSITIAMLPLIGGLIYAVAALVIMLKGHFMSRNPKEQNPRDSIAMKTPFGAPVVFFLFCMTNLLKSSDPSIVIPSIVLMSLCMQVVLFWLIRLRYYRKLPASLKVVYILMFKLWRGINIGAVGFQSAIILLHVFGILTTEFRFDGFNQWWPVVLALAEGIQHNIYQICKDAEWGPGRAGGAIGKQLKKMSSRFRNGDDDRNSSDRNRHGSSNGNPRSGTQADDTMPPSNDIVHYQDILRAV